MIPYSGLSDPLRIIVFDVPSGMPAFSPLAVVFCVAGRRTDMSPPLRPGVSPKFPPSCLRGLGGVFTQSLESVSPRDGVANPDGLGAETVYLWPRLLITSAPRAFGKVTSPIGVDPAVPRGGGFFELPAEATGATETASATIAGMMLSARNMMSLLVSVLIRPARPEPSGVGACSSLPHQRQIEYEAGRGATAPVVRFVAPFF